MSGEGLRAAIIALVRKAILPAAKAKPRLRRLSYEEEVELARRSYERALHVELHPKTFPSDGAPHE